MTTTQPTFEDFLAWLEDSRGRGQVHFDERAQCWQVLGHPEISARVTRLISPTRTVTFRAANRREQPCSAVARVSNSQHFVIVIADGAITKYSTLPVGRRRQGVDTTGGGQCRDVRRTDL